jgi:hypothetical protein
MGTVCLKDVQRDAEQDHTCDDGCIDELSNGSRNGAGYQQDDNQWIGKNRMN